MLTPEAVISECVRLASERAAALVHRRMKRGLSSLASVASTAALVGFLGSGLAIINSPGFSTYSEALVPTALGLVVAVLSLWTHHYISTQIEGLNVEMQTASRSFTVLSSPHGNGNTVFHTLIFRG
jgi:biopolymer transport protein ExbB/TolQ